MLYRSFIIILSWNRPSEIVLIGQLKILCRNLFCPSKFMCLLNYTKNNPPCGWYGNMCSQGASSKWGLVKGHKPEEEICRRIITCTHNFYIYINDMIKSSELCLSVHMDIIRIEWQGVPLKIEVFVLMKTMICELSLKKRLSLNWKGIIYHVNDWVVTFISYRSKLLINCSSYDLNKDIDSRLGKW